MAKWGFGMNYKSLLTVITDPRRVGPVLDAAAHLCARWDAHLDVLSLGVDRSQIGYSYIGGAAVLAQASIDRAGEEAAALDAAVRKKLGSSGIRWGAEAAVAQIGGVADIVAASAGYADLVLAEPPRSTTADPEGETVLEAVLFDARAPVLLMPEGAPLASLGERVVIAWNQGPQAMAAVRAAMPILKSAKTVDIAVIDPPAYGPERSDPGGPLAQMLSRHGVRAEVSVLALTLPRVSEVLVRHVRDRSADLLVMGAYGHSRLREALLGGTTRDFLEATDVPVLMAH